MLEFPTWKRVMLWAIAIIGALLALPSIASLTNNPWPDQLPDPTVNLGLDLAGGSHLLLEADPADVGTQRLQNMEETVRTDALTGLNNRRYFFELGRTALKKAIRAGKPLSAIMFDADLFKKVNDTYGHAVGDKALIHLSLMAQDALRDIDILARLGGEEFAVLLEGTDEEAAAEVAERLRRSINDKALKLERGSIRLSVSAGVACITPEGGDELDTLLVFADKALYAAKAGGRNRIVRYSQVSAEGKPPED